MELNNRKILVTVCARGGSKGVPGKNIRQFHGKPLIAHTIEQAFSWKRASRVVVSTDSSEIAEVARQFGAEVPFIRPSPLASDTSGKLPVIVHALKESERIFEESFDVVLDMDPTAPLRSVEDLENGWRKFLEAKAQLCFSVVRARKNPYFNMVERDLETGTIGLVKTISQEGIYSRQSAPVVWDMNASIYFYSRDFLLSSPKQIWEASLEMFEMPAHSAFDIDLERDFIVAEALFEHMGHLKERQ